MRSAASFVTTLAAAAALACACGDSATPTNGAATQAVTLTSFDGTVPPIELVLETPRLSIGEEVRLNTSGWPDAAPLEYYLLPPSTWRQGVSGLLSDEKAYVGQVVAERGAASISFMLKGSYVMESGTTLDIAPGGQLYIVLQRGGSAGARGTGPLMVE